MSLANISRQQQAAPPTQCEWGVSWFTVIVKQDTPSGTLSAMQPGELQTLAPQARQSRSCQWPGLWTSFRSQCCPSCIKSMLHITARPGCRVTGIVLLVPLVLHHSSADIGKHSSLQMLRLSRSLQANFSSLPCKKPFVQVKLDIHSCHPSNTASGLFATFRSAWCVWPLIC